MMPPISCGSIPSRRFRSFSHRRWHKQSPFKPSGNQPRIGSELSMVLALLASEGQLDCEAVHHSRWALVGGVDHHVGSRR